MPARVILALMLVTFVVPAFPQDEPPPATGDTIDVSAYIADLMKRAEQGDASVQFDLGLAHELG